MNVSNLVDVALSTTSFVLYIILGLASFTIPFVFHIIGYFIYIRFFKGVRLPKKKNDGFLIKEPKLLYQIFYLLPRQIIRDYFNKDVDAFDIHGIHLVVGVQGRGKTITLVHLVRKLKHLYPELKVFSNMSMTFSDGSIHSVEDLCSHDVGKTGKIEVIDECQNWFNSNESRNFPPEALGEICQQRKEYSLMLLTTQVYNNLVAQIKNQVDHIYNPHTFFGCFTVVRVYKVTRDESGTITGQRLEKLYSFVHDDEIRNCFDTREKIKRLVKGGFKPTNEQHFIQPFNISKN